MSFPKTIHQIWLQGINNIPEKYNTNILSIKQHNTDFEYKMWDEISILDIIHTNPTWTKTYYSFIYLHQKVDYARYIILWLMGGIYVDIDVNALKSFDSILEEFKDYDLIVSKLIVNKINSMLQCHHPECLNNGVIISKQKADILNEIIKYIDNNSTCSFICPKIMCINKTTGPLMFTKVINQYIKNNSGNKSKIYILPAEYLEPCTFGDCKHTVNTIVSHNHNCTWIPKYQYNIMKFYIKNTGLTIAIIILMLSIVIYFIYKFYKTKNK